MNSSTRTNGKPHRWALRPTLPAVAEHVATKIIVQLDVAYAPMQAAGLRPGNSITPGDGQIPTDDPLERTYDPEPRVWETAAGRMTFHAQEKPEDILADL